MFTRLVFQQDGGPRGAGQPRASGRWGRGLHPGAAPLPASSYTGGLEVRYLDETGLRGENKDLGCGKVAASNVGNGLRERGRLDVWARDACQSSKQASVGAPAAIVI